MTDQGTRIVELEAELARKTDEFGVLSRVAAEISSARDLDSLLSTILASLDDVFDFKHSMVLLNDASRSLLVVAASRGYAEAGIGAEVPLGTGVIASSENTKSSCGWAASRRSVPTSRQRPRRLTRRPPPSACRACPMPQAWWRSRS